MAKKHNRPHSTVNQIDTSASHQIAQLLQTNDATQQLKILQKLIQAVNTPSCAVTLVVAPGGGVVGISSTVKLEATQLMAVLAAGQQVLSAQIEAARQKSPEVQQAVGE
jgi:shikimate kinase